MTKLAKLMAECDARRIRLVPTADGGLKIEAPKNALIPELFDRLRANKEALLVALRPPATPARPCKLDHSARKSHIADTKPSASLGTGKGRAIAYPLIGRGFAPITPTIPPDAIRETPAVPCPKCNSASVLAELRRLTDGRCVHCWQMANALEVAEQSPAHPVDPSFSRSDEGYKRN